MFENFQINDGAVEDSKEYTSSDLIGPDGILQTLPNCLDLYGSDIKASFPNCCDDDSYDSGKCKRAFPKNVYLKMNKEGTPIPTKYRTADDSKYGYNPLYPYSRVKISDDVPITRKILNVFSMIVAFVSGDVVKGNIYNWGRIESAAMGTYPPVSGTNSGKEVTNWSNNKGLLDYYAKMVFLGKDKTGKNCSMENPDNCEPIGENRWEKIGECPNEPGKDLYTYIDVKNTYNLLSKAIPKGLASGVVIDMLRLNPITFLEDAEKVLFGNTKCMPKTQWENNAGRDNKTDGGHYYIPTLMEGPLNTNN